MGPVNFAGRVTSLAYDPDGRVLYAGAAAGGIWRSFDLGQKWIPPSPVLQPPIGNTDPALARIKGWPTNNIGSLAIDPHNHDHIVCGTGEANGSADAYPGCGIFHSLDRGETWHVLAYTTTAGLPRRIGTLAIDPNDPKRMAAGGTTHMESDAGGLFLSTDGGVTWAAVNLFEKAYHCHAVVFDTRSNLYATVDMRGANNGIFVSRGSEAPNQLGEVLTTLNGLPENLSIGRTSLALSPLFPGIVYAFIGNRRGGILGLYRTDNAGQYWTSVAGSRHFPFEHQLSYTNCIAVHPHDPNFVVIGGLDLHISRNGGRTWRQSTDDSLWPETSGSVHGDHHAILVLDDGTIVTGCDGGVYVSKNAGRSWSARHFGMQTTMFYSMDVAPGNPDAMGGGCQDNGTLVRDSRDRHGNFRYVIGGDGAWLAYDRDDAENIFGGYHEAHVFRHIAGRRDRWVNVSPEIQRAERKIRAIAVLAIEPVRRKGDRQKRVYLGTDRLWRTADWGKTWKPVSPEFDRSAISAIAIAPHNPDYLMVGTTRGGIFRSTDGSKTWSENFAGANIPMRLISSIEIFKVPESSGVMQDSGVRAICTVAGTGLGVTPVPKAFRQDRPDVINKGYSHVFACTMMGQYGWRDADGGRLPDMAYQCCAFEERPPYRVFIGGDFGVFMSGPHGFPAIERTFNLLSVPVANDFGWVNITGNLPNVIVSDLIYHSGEAALYACTYGRGIYRLKLGDAEWANLVQTAPPAGGLEAGW
jgi:photosystem II stability/assembly factor-like uncharacterized protein